MLDSMVSVASGGILGVAGSVISKILGIYESKQKRQDRLLDYHHELQLLTLQQQYQQQGLRMQSHAQIMQASYDHDRDSGVASLWVVNCLRLVRPILTLMLMIAVCAIAMQGDTPVYHLVTQSLLMCCSTAITWWFGDRSMQVRK